MFFEDGWELSQSYFTLGTALKEDGQLDEAVTVAKEGYAAFPDSPLLVLLLISLYTAKNDLKNAFKQLELLKTKYSNFRDLRDIIESSEEFAPLREHPEYANLMR